MNYHPEILHNKTKKLASPQPPHLCSSLPSTAWLLQFLLGEEPVLNLPPASPPWTPQQWCRDLTLLAKGEGRTFPAGCRIHFCIPTARVPLWSLVPFHGLHLHQIQSASFLAISQYSKLSQNPPHIPSHTYVVHTPKLALQYTPSWSLPNTRETQKGSPIQFQIPPV